MREQEQKGKLEEEAGIVIKDETANRLGRINICLSNLITINSERQDNYNKAKTTVLTAETVSIATVASDQIHLQLLSNKETLTIKLLYP